MNLYVNSLILAGPGGLLIGDMLTQLFFFIVLLVLLRIFAWGPIMGVMQKRENHIASEIETAEKNRLEAEQSSREAAEELKKTRQEAQSIIEDAKRAGQDQEQQIINTAREAAERMKVSAQQDIEREKEKAIAALQDQVASLSIQIASKVIEKEINAADQNKLINDYIKEVGEKR